MIEMRENSNVITIPTNHLIGLNEIIDASRKNKFLANNIKKKSQRISIELLTEQADLNDFYIDHPVRLKFTWHMADRRRDPDNISSAGRKILLDAMQEVIVNGMHVMLPRDSFNYLSGFQDDFSFDGESKVDIEIIDN